jgi:hypothetical protein
MGLKAMAKKKISPASYFGTKDRIAFLNRLSKNGASIASFGYALDDVLNAKLLPCTTIANGEIYRARWNQNGRLFELAHELIYPNPKNVHIPKGRLNDAEESIFYGSISILGTIIELRPEVNKFFTISTLRKNSGPDPFCYVVGDVKVLPSIRNPSSSDRLVRAYLDSELVKMVS